MEVQFVALLFAGVQVKDLLNPSGRDSLPVRWSKDKGFYVENLFIVDCETLDDLLAVLEEGKGLVFKVGIPLHVYLFIAVFPPAKKVFPKKQNEI